MRVGEYGQVATVLESPSELRTLFDEVEEYFEVGAKLSKGATVVDVGANIGAFAIAAARRCEREVRLWCFEPVPMLYGALASNLRDNDWLAPGKHRGFNVALSTPEEAGIPCDFYYFKRFPRDSTMDIERKREEFEAFFAAKGARARNAVRWLGPGARLVEAAIASLPKGPVGHWMSDRVGGLEKLQVPRDTLANALRSEDVGPIELLKVDVEGAELKVLGGIDDTTWTRVRQAVIEADGAEERTRALVELLEARGFASVKVVNPPSTQGRGLPNVILYATRS